MVVKHGQDEGQAFEIIQEIPIERDNANFATSFFILDNPVVVEHRPAECIDLSDNAECKQAGVPEICYPTVYTDGIQTNHMIPAYANISVNEGSIMTDQHHRQAIVMRRTDSFDSTDGNFSARNSMKYESEYECMSSPESFSNSSSNRSSNTSSFYGNISPDTISLASFAGRLNFGRFAGSKRSSQSSNASSQDSGRQSWGKLRDSFDLSDPGASYYVRRTSSEQVYENTRPFTPEYFMRFPKVDSDHMEVTDQGESPPPLPSRQNQSVAAPTKEPEMIMPYKVVDLDELQRSLEDIEPYYIHDGSKDVDNDFYNECSDPIEEDIESDEEVADSDFRPVLPPKKKTLSHSQSDSSFKSTNALEDLAKERPTPLPRQSLILSDIAQAHTHDGTILSGQTNESTNLAERSWSGSSHQSRRESLPSGRAPKTRQKSPSPHTTVRPVRSAPPPPPPRSSSPAARGFSSRPVSEMFPQAHNINRNSPVTLKRSMTVSILQSPFTRRKVDSLNKERIGDKSSDQISNSPPTTLPSAQVVDEKSKEDMGKAGTSKTGAFFGKSKAIKKAFSTLKIPGTKKATKKELAISPPSDFTSLYQTRLITDYSNREQKTVSFLATDHNDDEVVDSDVSAVMSEPAAEVAEHTGDECEVATEDPEDEIEQLTFHPEFTERSTGDVDQHDEQFYYNFPISQALVDNTGKMLSPKKPPRSGYLQPSMSQRTIEREEEISLNKLPELGPLPTPPGGSSSSISSNSSPAMTPESDATVSVITDKNESTVTTPENHMPSEAATESDDQKVNGKPEKSSRKPKPEVPRRPNTLKLKPKVPNKPVQQSSDKPIPIPRSLTLDTSTLEKSKKSVDRNNERRHSTPLEETAGLSRSCDFLDIDDPRDNYITDMHLIVLKDILRCWRNMLRKPTIDLAGACWEDFEMVESESWPKITEDKSSVSLPVRLRMVSPNSDTHSCCRQYIAKIKCQSQANSSTKSLFDQDYSVCSCVESHENISRVLAYFRGDIRSTILGLGDETSPLHTTISVSDQVPGQTCAEFAAQSKDAHSKDPLSYERTVCMLMVQCLKGVIHLHDSGFTHGNLNLNNLFLIRHADNDCQLLIANFGKSQPLAKERRASNLYTKSDDSPKQNSSLQNDLAAISEIMTAMLHQDQNGNGTHSSKVSSSTLSGHLRQASERLRDGSASPHHVVRFLQALLWGPFKLGENIVIVSESRMKQWLERQRGEFIARLAMDEALARTVGGNSRKFSMEDLLLCEYLTVATPSALVRTEKRWLLAT